MNVDSILSDRERENLARVEQQLKVSKQQTSAPVLVRRVCVRVCLCMCTLVVRVYANSASVCEAPFVMRVF